MTSGPATPNERLSRLAVVCEHDKVYKHQAPILDRFGQPVSFGNWCEEGKFVTFAELAQEFAVEMVAALIDVGVLDEGGKNPHIEWE